jgi:hypothetical protein
MAQLRCSQCLFEGWNEKNADLLPMEFADGKTRLTQISALSFCSKAGTRPMLIRCQRSLWMKKTRLSHVAGQLYVVTQINM